MSTRPRLRVLALVPYPLDTAPGQRYRIEQWAPYLREEGIDVHFEPFAGAALSAALYRPGRLRHEGMAHDPGMAQESPHRVARRQLRRRLPLPRSGAHRSGVARAPGPPAQPAPRLRLRRRDLAALRQPSQPLPVLPQGARQDRRDLPHGGGRHGGERDARRLRPTLQSRRDRRTIDRVPSGVPPAAPPARGAPRRSSAGREATARPSTSGSSRARSRRSPAGDGSASSSSGSTTTVSTGSTWSAARGGPRPRSRICGRWTSGSCRSSTTRGRAASAR